LIVNPLTTKQFSCSIEGMGADYRSFLTEGIPIGNLTKASRITDAGVQGSGMRWLKRSSDDEGRAADVIGQTMRNSASHPYSLRKNPYFQLSSTRYYQGGAGLGADDYDGDMAERIVGYGADQINNAPALAPRPTGGSSASWQDVLQSMSKTIVGGLATGLTNLVGGRPVVAMAAPAPSTGPSLPVMLAIGGAIGIPLFLFMRRHK
jgi:hypothetical protein